MPYATKDPWNGVAVETVTTDSNPGNGAQAKALYVVSQAASLNQATDRSGTASTTSATLAAANTARRGLEIQNVGANNIGVNEFGAAAVIGAAGTYTLLPGATMRVKTTRLITAIAATGATPYTATEY